MSALEVTDSAPSRSRLRVGVDVPWVTSWSEEPLGGVRPCPYAGGHPAIQQTSNAGFGRPIYSQNHLVRQRWSVRSMVCPMCGLQTGNGDRWSQTSRVRSAGQLREKGLGHLIPSHIPDRRRLLDAGGIAPLHDRCVRLSHERCPHLQAHATARPLPFPARWVVAPLLVEARPPASRVLLRSPATAPLPVISFLQLWGVMD